MEDHNWFLIFKTMRPKQWIKNLLLFAALIFSQNLFHPGMLKDVSIAFIIFCLLSGSVYTLNDLIDLKQDRNHPKKSKRPLAAGKLKPSVAIIAGIGLGGFSVRDRGGREGMAERSGDIEGSGGM